MSNGLLGSYMHLPILRSYTVRSLSLLSDGPIIDSFNGAILDCACWIRGIDNSNRRYEQ